MGSIILVVCLIGMMKFMVVNFILLMGESLAMLEEPTCTFDEHEEVERGFHEYRARLWENGIVPYKRHHSFNDNDWKVFEEAVEVIENNTCIRFSRYGGWGPYLHLTRECGCGQAYPEPCVGGGYVIGVGSGTPRTLVLSTGCLERHNFQDVVLMTHEIFHALGVGHTQKRKDRDDYIMVNEENILEDKKGSNKYQFEKCRKCAEKTELRELPYDCSSIMHYRDYAYSKRPGLKTMTAWDPKTCDLSSSIIEFPETDWILINRMYKSECQKRRRG